MQKKKNKTSVARKSPVVTSTPPAASSGPAVGNGETITTVYGEAVPVALLSHITPALRPLAVAISSLKRDPRNARGHGPKSIESIAASFKRFGQQKPVVFDESRTIRAGSGGHEAGSTLGWTYIAAIQSDLAGDELKAFALSDNRTAELSYWLGEEVERQLQELADVDIDLADMGLGEVDLEQMLAEAEKTAAAAEPESEEEKSSGTGSGGGKDQFKIIVECKNEADQVKLLKRFAKDGMKCRALVG